MAPKPRRTIHQGADGSESPGAADFMTRDDLKAKAERESKRDAKRRKQELAAKGERERKQEARQRQKELAAKGKKRSTQELTDTRGTDGQNTAVASKQAPMNDRACTSSRALKQPQPPTQNHPKKQRTTKQAAVKPMSTKAHTPCMSTTHC